MIRNQFREVMGSLLGPRSYLFRWSKTELLIAVLLAIAMPSCSVRFAANGTLPDSAKTIYVERFANNTRVPGVNDQFMVYLKQEVSSRDRLLLADRSDEADLILRGTVLYYGTEVKTVNSISEPLDYGDTLSVSAQLIDRKSNKVIWSTRAISSSTMVPVVGQAIIPTTPQFLRQNLRGADLANMPDMQVAASEQSSAKQQLMAQAASELYTDMAWGL
jgi:hypothetical protein